MADDPYEVVAISRSGHYSMLQNGTAVIWDSMLDRECQSVTDVEQARFALYQQPDGEWVTLDLSYWVNVTLH